MAWRRPGDKLLSEAMMVKLLMHICITQPQWVKSTSFMGSRHSEILTPYMLIFFLGNVKSFLHFPSFLDFEMAQIDEIISHRWQGPPYFTQSIPWLLMAWQCRKPGHQQPRYWPSLLGIFQSVSRSEGLRLWLCHMPHDITNHAQYWFR